MSTEIDEPVAKPDHSLELGELFGALSALQGELSGIGKDAANPFFKSHYASLGAVLRATNPLLGKHGLCLTQLPHGNVLRSILGHKSGQWISAAYPIRPVKDDPQGVGSAITYARRYSAMAILGVAPEDDDGEAASGRTTAKADAKAKPASVPATLAPDKRAAYTKKIRALEVDLKTLAGDGVTDAIMQETLGELIALAKLTDAQLETYGKALAKEIAANVQQQEAV